MLPLASLFKINKISPGTVQLIKLSISKCHKQIQCNVERNNHILYLMESLLVLVN